ncbi:MULTISPECIES: DUF559 domain-containing protein [Prevotellaceae]|uniref:DUF559 domain-containing protein n=1 Tax=Hallella seregens ATCC 51272 TaxID=1336250 RepID=A0ABV5ZMT3_9BACT
MLQRTGPTEHGCLRTEALETQGFRAIRFTSSEVFNPIEQVIKSIKRQ